MHELRFCRPRVLRSEYMRARTDEFARRVIKTEDLPERLRPMYLEALKIGSCRSFVYAPPIGNLRNLPARYVEPIAGYLLMNFDDYLMVIIDRAGHPLGQVRVALGDLICVEIGELLLFSWIKLIFGVNETREIKIPFNTVRADLFVDSLNLIRNTIELPMPVRSGLVSITPDLDLKFKNVLHRWLWPKEVLLGFAFQPEVRARRFLLLERQVMPPFLAALTDRQFVTITEEPPAAFESLGQFSQIHTYCPHSRIKSATVRTNRGERKFAEFDLTLGNGNARYYVKTKVTGDLAAKFEALCRSTNEFLAQHRSSEEVPA
jgi:hypothetical protein